MFEVLDNGKPAIVGSSNEWNNNKFELLSDARNYAYAWLGAFAHNMDTLEVNKPVDYSGYGDMIEIRVVE